MKIIRYKLVAALLFSVCFNSIAQSDDQLIIDTVNDYLEGGTNGEVERFKGAFLPDAIQKSIGKSGVTGMTVDALASKIKPGQKMERTTKIVSWSYAGTAATAVTETEYPTSKIVDLLNLLKVGGEWKIASRVFSRIEKEENITSSSPAPTVATKTTAKGGKTPPPPSAAKPKKPATDDGW
ncbi:hypothetical protein GVN16_03175 [Emticicia sp. CRIBPO]|uniref:nuclear transport factor 2 family protein n=1 Tax=Emticicia sp. CRIBPO TaxID=2683258 RepID=UPI001412C4CD|nr:nuclear transport factor 2 family protein [Emticicia sp. CRIBPO]NBA84742.1 hypothetical protein [Emticicia sp. CRIBPO]